MVLVGREMKSLPAVLQAAASLEALRLRNLALLMLTRSDFLHFHSLPFLPVHTVPFYPLLLYTLPPDSYSTLYLQYALPFCVLQDAHNKPVLSVSLLMIHSLRRANSRMPLIM